MTFPQEFPWWALILMGIGIFALGTLIVNLFFAVGDRPDSAEQHQRCPVGSTEFLLALSSVLNAPLHRGGTARLLNNGDEFFPAMLDAIAKAERSINFTSYIWKNGKVSDAFMDALAERARAGVEIRVLIDALGGLRAPRTRIRELRRLGVRWERFQFPRFGNLTRLHKRNHRRAIVIDGSIGFTGGASVMDKWMGDARNPKEWRDCMVEVRGRLALSLQSAFTQLWTHTTGEMLAGDKFYPLDAHEAEHTGEGQPIRRHINVVSSPSSEAHPMRQVFWYSIKSAEQRIYITNPYFVPDNLLLAALKERARAGVDLRVLVPNHYNDVRLIRWASHSYYEELLEAGIRIFEFQPAMIHQKLMVVDGILSIIGSVNMDVRSKELNQENCLVMADEGFSAEVEAAFFADLERSEEMHLDVWRQRSAARKVNERFFRLFEEQF